MCVPSVRAGTVVVATPATRLTGPPNVAPSRLNWTWPVGVPEPGRTAVTVAVSVTAWVVVEGLGLPATEVVVEALVTGCVAEVAALVSKLASPW